jgi:lipopolysaccharide/colanic/teichoic acid biosynthesis glycosyltransferase
MSAVTTPLRVERVTVAEDRRMYQRFVKPAIDAAIAFLLLVGLLPALLIALVAVRISLGKGVIFRQQRVGRDGVPFTIYKLHTMHPDRRRQAVPVAGTDRRRCHKTPTDPRVTNVGRVLRALSIDELPQMVNVLRGQMSLVGPRPELVQIAERYEPWQHARHAVKPGITGLWQISERSDTPMHEATSVDLDYVENVSFRTDISILARTIPAILLRRGF